MEYKISNCCDAPIIKGRCSLCKENVEPEKFDIFRELGTYFQPKKQKL